MTSDSLALLKQNDPSKRRRHLKGLVEVYKNDLPLWASTDPEYFREILSNVKQEDMANYLAALNPEQLQALIKLVSEKQQSKEE